MRPRLTGAAGESATPGALAIRGRPLKRARRLGMGVDVAEAVAGDGFLHRALLYRGAAEFRAAIERYVRGGLARAEPVLVATSPGKVSWLRREFNASSAGVAFTDMTEVGRNPARIMPAIHAFMARYPGRRIWCLGEPVWPERSAAELR